VTGALPPRPLYDGNEAGTMGAIVPIMDSEGGRRLPPGAEVSGSAQLAGILGLATWQIRAATHLGVISSADTKAWPHIDPSECELLAARVRSAVGETPPLAASRAARYLSRRLGFQIRRYDVLELTRRGMLRASGVYLERPVYLQRHLNQLISRAIDRRRRSPSVPITDMPTRQPLPDP